MFFNVHFQHLLGKTGIVTLLPVWLKIPHFNEECCSALLAPPNAGTSPVYNAGACASRLLTTMANLGIVKTSYPV